MVVALLVVKSEPAGGSAGGVLLFGYLGATGTVPMGNPKEEPDGPRVAHEHQPTAWPENAGDSD